jgi:hypothetical protein
MPYEMTLNHTISNSDSLAHVAGVHEHNVRADIGLRIALANPEDGQFDFTLFGPAIQSAGLNLNGYSKLKPAQVFAAVEECRKEWMSSVVDFKRQVQANGKMQYETPFQAKWDFKDDPALLKDVAPRLALAGDKLFTSIFELDSSDADLKKIGQALRDLSSATPRCIAITSRVMFLPWGMLYTHPVPGETLFADGSNWTKDGFWGYRHIVQQSPENIDTINGISPDKGSVALSVNFDDRIFSQEKPPVTAAHIAFLGELAGSKFIKRTKKAELANGFTRGRDGLERILYFYCHGHGSSSDSGVSVDPPHLLMVDGKVAASDFQIWAKEKKKLPTSPLVFINACQGGQMTTMFYESFAVELLKQGAVGLVGAQIDVPTVFGPVYAQRLFEKFFAKDKGRVRLGPLMREANQVMWDDHNNPLGLIYSLYLPIETSWKDVEDDV